jgi:hypothetical protein
MREAAALPSGAFPNFYETAKAASPEWPSK